MIERVRVLEPDFAARKIIVAAFLYYVMDSPTMSDAEYDRLSKIVADGWDEISKDRQWALGDPDTIRNKGNHIRFSSHAVGAALNHHKYKTGVVREDPREWWKERRDGVRYVTCACKKPPRVN